MRRAGTPSSLGIKIVRFKNIRNYIEYIRVSFLHLEYHRKDEISMLATFHLALFFFYSFFALFSLIF
ncbi:hypothetical protein APY31_04755 [Listeria monocytogenes]|nr:hypothetical protein APY31_04755 [Listeria monocytogenes]